MQEDIHTLSGQTLVWMFQDFNLELDFRWKSLSEALVGSLGILPSIPPVPPEVSGSLNNVKQEP